MKYIFFALLVVCGLIEVGLEGVISASGLLHVLSGFTSVQLFGSIFMILSPRIHLPPLSSHPSSSHTLPNLLPAGRHSVSMMWD